LSRGRNLVGAPPPRSCRVAVPFLQPRRTLTVTQPLRWRCVVAASRGLARHNWPDSLDDGVNFGAVSVFGVPAQQQQVVSRRQHPTFVATRKGVRCVPSIITISGLTKAYASGFQALKGVDLSIEEGEIFALLGPNGAGKTTMISIICGNVRATGGSVTVAGHDIVRDYRGARSAIGLVPQELSTDQFERVIDTVNFSRGLFGKPRNDAYIEKILRDLSLWEKRKSKILELSGGMKRRVMIAKALSHEPRVLFLDEPTAGVDVELRRDMWKLIGELRKTGVTIILTTHYIEEAEEMADRVGVITRGELMLVEEKTALMKKLGKKTLTIVLTDPLDAVPAELAEWDVTLKGDGREIEYVFDTQAERTGVSSLLRRLGDLGIGYKDLNTQQSSLEDIFVSLVHQEKAA
jgi:ABC-2 type transport system ATP-binding protein